MVNVNTIKVFQAVNIFLLRWIAHTCNSDKNKNERIGSHTHIDRQTKPRKTLPYCIGSFTHAHGQTGTYISREAQCGYSTYPGRIKNLFFFVYCCWQDAKYLPRSTNVENKADDCFC
jgi:hypothetical protein